MRQRYRSDIEILMCEALKNNNINFCEQFPIRGKYSYQLDFAIVDLKIDIETDGKHWHKVGNTHDRKRNWTLRNKGWKILRFTCDEIKNNINICIAKIEKTIEWRKIEHENQSKN